MREGASDVVRHGAVAAVALCVLAVGVAYGAAFARTPPPAWAAGLMAAGTVGAIVAAMALGAVKGGHLGGLGLAFAAVAVLVGGGFGALLALPAAGPVDPPLILGLPPRAAILLYGIGLLPTLVVPVAYALTFEGLTLSDEDLERVRRARERREAAAGGAGSPERTARAEGDDGSERAEGPDADEGPAGEPSG